MQKTFFRRKKKSENFIYKKKKHIPLTHVKSLVVFRWLDKIERDKFL